MKDGGRREAKSFYPQISQISTDGKGVAQESETGGNRYFPQSNLCESGSSVGSRLTIQHMTHCFHSVGFSFLATREMVAMMKAQACGLHSLERGNASATGVLLLITVFMVRERQSVSGHSN